ncbi:acyltransferase domain-containing protein, partial [Frankia sp. AiPa1]|uniref:CurL C-terminal domain-containing protein n=1 Tax=Frankia sp. AiPa1 TaxID=573492 RepID=UPI00202AD1B3
TTTHRAAISSFGISGTNAHLILEQPPGARQSATAPVQARDRQQPDITVALPLSAHSPAALQELAARLSAFLGTRPEIALPEVAAALSGGRANLEHRAVVTGSTRAEVLDGLRTLARGETAAGVVRGRVRPRGRTAFLFTGQGSQRAGAGLELYRSEPPFAAALDAVFAQIDPLIGRSLAEIMFAVPGSPEEQLLHTTEYAQPALFA